MAPTGLHAAASAAAARPGVLLGLADWLTAHPVWGGLLIGAGLVASHIAGCRTCRTRHRKHVRRRAEARARLDRIGGRVR